MLYTLYNCTCNIGNVLRRYLFKCSVNKIHTFKHNIFNVCFFKRNKLVFNFIFCAFDFYLELHSTIPMRSILRIFSVNVYKSMCIIIIKNNNKLHSIESTCLLFFFIKKKNIIFSINNLRLKSSKCNEWIDINADSECKS